jgi:hypothetical protein
MLLIGHHDDRAIIVIDDCTIGQPDTFAEAGRLPL